MIIIHVYISRITFTQNIVWQSCLSAILQVITVPYDPYWKLEYEMIFINHISWSKVHRLYVDQFHIHFFSRCAALVNLARRENKVPKVCKFIFSWCHSFLKSEDESLIRFLYGLSYYDDYLRLLTHCTSLWYHLWLDLPGRHSRTTSEYTSFGVALYFLGIYPDMSQKVFTIYFLKVLSFLVHAPPLHLCRTSRPLASGNQLENICIAINIWV